MVALVTAVRVAAHGCAVVTLNVSDCGVTFWFEWPSASVQPDFITKTRKVYWVLHENRSVSRLIDRDVARTIWNEEKDAFSGVHWTA